MGLKCSLLYNVLRLSNQSRQANEEIGALIQQVEEVLGYKTHNANKGSFVFITNNLQNSAYFE